MVRRMARRLLVGVMLTLVGATTVALGPTAAQAAGPDQITISGDDLTEPLVVSAEEHPELLAALYSEVDWLIGRPSQGEKPTEDALGPRYRVVVHVKGKARHRFNLYPLAEGGPRAHRPAKQPGDREVNAGWFYGRLSMPDTLASAGVPLSGDGGLSGGVGGGDATSGDNAAAPGLSDVLDEWQEGMQITGVVMIVIIVGLAGVALLIRRRV